jgi:hypothetical protein
VSRESLKNSKKKSPAVKKPCKVKKKQFLVLYLTFKKYGKAKKLKLIRAKVFIHIDTM